MSGQVAKIAKMAKNIGTHNGTFHCDEVLACFMLRQLPEYKDASITRTRDAAVLAMCDVVVDVGGEYCHEKLRYDHHQRSFSESMSSLLAGKQWVTRLSSAGLVYAHYGHRVLAAVLHRSETDALVQTIFDKMYERLIQEVDAIDNGISVAEGELRYMICSNLSSRVQRLNPAWNDPEANEEAGFERALRIVGEEFMERLHSFSEVWWPARSLVEQAISQRIEVDPSGEIVLLSRFCPWKEHIYALEKELCLETDIKFVLFADSHGSWRVSAVSVRPDSFENRVSLAEPWRGVRDEKLSELSGIPGCIFVHANGFIGGNASYEGALHMAQRSLEMERKK